MRNPFLSRSRRGGRDAELEITVGEDHPWFSVLVDTRNGARLSNTQVLEIAVGMEGYVQMFTVREVQVRDDPHQVSFTARLRATPISDPMPIPATPAAPALPTPEQVQAKVAQITGVRPQDVTPDFQGLYDQALELVKRLLTEKPDAPVLHRPIGDRPLATIPDPTPPWSRRLHDAYPLIQGGIYGGSAVKKILGLGG